MTALPMTLERFRELAAAYGSKLERWPEQERKAAALLLATSAQAERIMQEEGFLDGELSGQASHQSFQLSGAFERKLAEIPLRNPQRSAWSLFRRWLWAPALGWSVAAALGVFLGAQFADVDSDEAAQSSESARLSTDSAQASTEETIDALALGDIVDWEEGTQ